MQSLVNGMPADTISIGDRGLQFGDGCFETIAISESEPLLWDRHMTRLFDSCKVLGIEINLDAATLRKDVESLVDGNDRAVAKIVVTRGPGGRGYRTNTGEPATRIVSIHDWPDRDPMLREQGIELRVCKTRLSCNPVLAGCKHCNRLEQVMARAEWDDDYQEGLMLNASDEVIEGTMSNVFLQLGSTIVTPRLTECGVKGVMRAEILDKLSALGVAYREESVTMDMVYKADALFVSNSLIGLWPVKKLEQYEYPVSDLERQIQDAISKVIVK